MRELDWYVLTVSPLCERAVASRLKRLFGGVRLASGEVQAPDGVATWIANVSREVRRRGTRYQVEHNVMPRYVFFGHAGVVPWLDVINVTGVHGVLGIDGVPRAIAAEIVGAMIVRAECGDFAPGPPPPVQCGMGIVAVRGGYKGEEGHVTSIDKRRGVADVVFDLLGEGVVEMNLDDLISRAYPSRRMIG